MSYLKLGKIRKAFTFLLLVLSFGYAYGDEPDGSDEPVVSISLKNDTDGKVFWLMAFEETDALDGLLREELGHWLPTRIYELNGDEMTVVFHSVELKEEGGRTTFIFSPINSKGERIDTITYNITTRSSPGDIPVQDVEKISDDLIYLHFDFGDSKRRWMFKRVNEVSEFEDVSVSKAAIGFNAGNRWESEGKLMKVD